MEENPKFHAHNGWHFERTPEKGVKITILGIGGEGRGQEMANIGLTANEWASIVAHVAGHGASAVHLERALSFQEGRPEPIEEKPHPKSHSKK